MSTVVVPMPTSQPSAQEAGAAGVLCGGQGKLIMQV